jgi:YidC/Oxa1 family membrane protein insertase
MAKMKRMQPELKRVQEKYANDRVKTQQELVRLYKKYEVNPMSGIIPIFIQIPVFFSLYRVISISIDMRQAPFIGYIKDLSSGDPTTIFNLFGLLPFHVGFRVGLLPCLMALTMYIQQKTTENMQQDDTSMSSQMRDVNRTTKYLPLIFLLMFSNFPSGLLLYWIFNNIITIIQQKYMSKTLDTLPKSNEI